MEPPAAVTARETPYAFGPALRRRLARNLATLGPERVDDPALRRAATALVVAPFEDGGAGFFLTLRPTAMRRHGGQFALPGGRLDDGESVVAAALRELEEEIGLRLTPDDVVGTLDDFPTRSGFAITPTVFWADDPPALRPDPAEVAAVYRIPLAELDLPGVPTLGRGKGEDPLISLTLPTIGHAIFAPTAAVIYQFREVAMNGRPVRVAAFEQPVFAWS